MVKVIVEALCDIVEYGIKKGDSVNLVKTPGINTLFKDGGKQVVEAFKNQKGVDLSKAMGKYRGSFVEKIVK